MIDTKKNILFISDLLKPPYDEGAKIVAENILVQLKNFFNDSQVFLLNNKLYSFMAIKLLLFNKSDFVLYLPEASITFNSFLRAKIISILSRKKVFMISTQPRRYKPWQKYIVPLIQPHALFVQSHQHCLSLKSYGINNVFVNSWGVDLSKFCRVDKSVKKKLRRKYCIPEEKKVYLHFGHLKDNRNFSELEILLNDVNNYVLVVCSTTTEQKLDLKKKLMGKGFNFITDFITDNQELYQLSDYYVFPTLDPMSAIELPLSVFESLACGIPVFHKPFGALKDLFSDGYSNLRQYENPEDLNKMSFNSDNSFPIDDYTWKNVVKNMLFQIEKTMPKKRNFICLAGIDGSGKSTVAEHLTNITNDHFYYIWARWEPFLLSPFMKLINKKSRDSVQSDEDQQHRKKQRLKNKLLRNRFIKKLWLILAEIDYFLQLLGKVLLPYICHRDIICDRYIYDFYIDQLINIQDNPKSLRKFILKRILSLFPKPDLLIYIKISPKTGNIRKQDGTSVSYLAQRKGYYDQLVDIYKTIEIDGELALNDVLNKAANSLNEHLNNE
ncbi:MAG: glycosyltransferase [archaeon]|nr:glycosyltransferase [archaeon]